MKVGDLVKDRHYGVGCVVEIGNRGSYADTWVRVSFPKYQNLAPGGVLALWNDHVRELKIILNKSKSFTSN